MTTSTKKNTEDYLQMYRQMVKIRAFEDNANKLYLSAKMPGLTHMYSGQEAVAVGIVVESFLSVFHSKLKKVELDEIKTYIFSQFEKYNIEKSEIKALIELMHSDKKNDENGINFTLLTRIGACEINFNLTDEDVSQALEWYMGI